VKPARATVQCPHQAALVPPVKNRFTCGLGFYGGKPYLGNCTECATSGENTPEHAAQLIATREISHPSNKPAVSGCCDPVIS